MRRISVVFLGVAILMVTVADTARAGFGTGVIVGVMISRGQSVGSGDSNVLYVMPRVNERVKDSLEMKMAATYSMYFGPHSSDAGKSLKELFPIFAISPTDKPFFFAPIATFAPPPPKPS